MKNDAPYKIGSRLKHCSGVVIKLERYDTQIIQSLHLSATGENIRKVPNYNYLFGIDLSNNESFNGLTKDFELLSE